MEYPIYYRKNGRCMKCISPTVAYLITLPPDSNFPLRDIVTYPTQERMQEELKTWNPTDELVWTNFKFTFYQSIKEEYTKEGAAMAMNYKV